MWEGLIESVAILLLGRPSRLEDVQNAFIIGLLSGDRQTPAFVAVFLQEFGAFMRPTLDNF